jgi:hypothetical protein
MEPFGPKRACDACSRGDCAWHDTAREESIGDYYERKREAGKKAWARYAEHRLTHLPNAHKCSTCSKLYNAALDAGNTGD